MEKKDTIYEIRDENVTLQWILRKKNHKGIVKKIYTPPKRKT